MPKERITRLAVPLKKRITGFSTNVKASWNGTTIFAVARGTASAKFFGTSSPMIIENRVASTIATTVPTAGTIPAGMPMLPSGSRSSELIAGSNVKPASSVVRVMPSCALDRCVEVTRSAEIVGRRPFSPWAWRRSSSARFRLTSANSDATKKPVPTVRITPMMMPQVSEINAHLLFEPLHAAGSR
ncbi:hypothetical protein ACI1US_02443 [Leucobacter sp. BZR 635]